MKTNQKTLVYYIPKLLKNISKCYITQGAKQHMHSILTSIARIIIQYSVQLLQMSNKSILNTKTLTSALQLLFSNDLLTNMLKEGETHTSMNSVKEVRSSLVLSHSFFKHFISENIPTHVKVAKKYPIFLTAAIEYICVEILDLSSIQALKNEHVRITTRDIFLSIHYDKELTTFFHNHNIKIIGSGVIPHNDELDTESRLLQRSTHLLFPKASFNNMVRYICKDTKISKQAFSVLQYYIENYMIELLQRTGSMCIYTGISKITEKDLDFIYNTSG